MNPENMFIAYSRPQLPTHRRASQVPVDDWKKHRQIISDLYIGQDKTLNEVVGTMKREYGFDATPRQYTQKLKSWKLQKNMRRNMARKPRSTASIYRRPTSRRHDSPSSKSVRPNLDEGVAHMSANQEKNEPRHHPAEIEDRVRPYQTLGVENVGETHDTAEGPGVATALDPHIAMCMYMIQNWFRFPGNYSIATNIHTDRRIFETAGDL